jgi:hypothetical protein
MIQGPSVFVPTPPEGDGITLPTLLSVLAHGLLIGFILYTHQAPTLETPPGIEATMVSPEQLAEMQGQILANRAAMAEMGASGAGDSEFAPMESSESFSSQSSRSASASSSGSRRVPVFVRSDAPSDMPTEDGIMVTREYQQQVQEAEAEYERKMAELAAQIDQAWQNDEQAIQDQARQSEQIRQERVNQLKRIEASQPTVQRPKRPDAKTGNKSKDSDRISIDLADGQAKVSNQGSPNSNSNSSSNSAGSSGRSVSSYKNDIVNKIQSHFTPPYGSESDFTNLSLRLDANGNVLSASASGSSPEVNAAAESAAFAASPLPIDTSNPKAFASIRVKIKGS